MCTDNVGSAWKPGTHRVGQHDKYRLSCLKERSHHITWDLYPMLEYLYERQKIQAVQDNHRTCIRYPTARLTPSLAQISSFNDNYCTLARKMWKKNLRTERSSRLWHCIIWLVKPTICINIPLTVHVFHVLVRQDQHGISPNN